VGVDWSAEGIKKARRKFPQYAYELANIRDAKAPARADLVMMLDVIGPEANPWNRTLLARALTWAKQAVLLSVKAPDHDTRDQAWKIFLDQLETVSPGFREVGHLGTELFVLKTQ
jgi:trans-aconitate methyltransferase